MGRGGQVSDVSCPDQSKNNWYPRLGGTVIRPHAYKTFFMLNSAEHEISKLDKSNLINLLEKLLTCEDFHCFCLSNQSFKFNLPYSLKDKLGFKTWTQTQLSMDSSFISTDPDLSKIPVILIRLAHSTNHPQDKNRSQLGKTYRLESWVCVH